MRRPLIVWFALGAGLLVGFGVAAWLSMERARACMDGHWKHVPELWILDSGAGEVDDVVPAHEEWTCDRWRDI